MLLIREFENGALDLYSKNLIKGSIHLYVGQEATATGICSNLSIKKGDTITTTHRGHGHIIALGGDVNKMMSELLGKKTGLCKGRGGSMHIADTSIGVFGANGIVGAGIPIAAGIAFASNYMEKDFISVTFFGDGASNQGVLYESMNMASAWGLPVLFVCENNLYAQTTPSKGTTAGKDLKSRAESFDIKSVKINGNDVEEVFDTSGEVIEEIRKKRKPFFIEATTYRLKGHWQGDPEVYRSKNEVNDWAENKCPIKSFKEKLISIYKVPAEKISEIEKEIREEISRAKEFAIKSEFPDKNELLDFLY